MLLVIKTCKEYLKAWKSLREKKPFKMELVEKAI